VSIVTNLFTARDAIEAIARTHQQPCDCTVCQAAAGDEDAFAEVLDAVRALAEITPRAVPFEPDDVAEQFG
jgi:hypothetical protein